MNTKYKKDGKAMNNEYKKNRYVCPFCGSDDTDPDNDGRDTDDYGFAFDDALVYHYRHCCECGTSYKLIYRPTRVVRL